MSIGLKVCPHFRFLMHVLAPYGGQVKWSILATFLIIFSPRSRETACLWSVSVAPETSAGRSMGVCCLTLTRWNWRLEDIIKKPKTTDNYKKGVLTGV